MSNIRVIRRRIEGVHSIARMTHAMEMIASSKMGRARAAARASRPYSEHILAVVSGLAASFEKKADVHPLLVRRAVKKITLIHIAPDRGLCGGMDSSVNQTTARFLKKQTVPVNLIAIGHKAVDFAHRTNLDLRAEIPQIGYRPTMDITRPISKIVIEDYEAAAVDCVYVVYTKFFSTSVHKPVIEKILPIDSFQQSTSSPAIVYIYEPDPAGVLATLLPRFVDLQIYHAVADAVASEQSARMVAMRSATDNAEDMIKDLTLEYNKVRQESITNGILDITRGAEALK